MRDSRPSRSIAVSSGPRCCSGSPVGYAAISKRPPVNPGVDPCPLKMAVGQAFPPFPQIFRVLAAVPVILLLLLFGRRETVLVDLPQRAPNMHVNVTVIAVGV